MSESDMTLKIAEYEFSHRQAKLAQGFRKMYATMFRRHKNWPDAERAFHRSVALWQKYRARMEGKVKGMAVGRG